MCNGGVRGCGRCARKEGRRARVGCGECEMDSVCLCYTVVPNRVSTSSYYVSQVCAAPHVTPAVSFLIFAVLPASKLSVADKPQ